MHRLRDFQEQFAGAHDKAGVGVADAGGEFVEGAGHASMGIGAEKNFAGARVALLRQRGVADARIMRAVLLGEGAFGGVKLPGAVGIVDDVVEVRQFLLAHKIAQDIDVAIGLGVGGENVVIGMMTTLLRSQTLALAPNSRLKTPMVPGPQTSWVMRMSALTQTLSPAATLALPAARAKIFSVKVITSA